MSDLQWPLNVHRLRRVREIALSLSQLRIEREREAMRRAEEDRFRNEQERALQLELTRLTEEHGA
jgi:hypothetical protein